MTGTPTHLTWSRMWGRCTNEKHKSYESYRLFVPVDRWRSFENFLQDMGEKPPGMSLDRIDNSKGYSPDNCRWADAYTQQGNTRRNIYVELLDGEVMCLKAACRKVGQRYSRAKGRVQDGWHPLAAITTPCLRGPEKGTLLPNGVFAKDE